MSRADFIAHLRTRLAAYPWASDAAKLDRFMAAVDVTLSTSTNAVLINGDAFVAAWHAIGGKGKPTYKSLRALT